MSPGGSTVPARDGTPGSCSKRAGSPCSESQLALAAVARLPAGDQKAAKILRELAHGYGVPNVDNAALRHLR